MDWFRYHHGTQQDAKLTMIAKKIGVRRCEMTAVWDELMDYASRNVTQCHRGHVTGIDLEVVAFTQEIELENVQKIYDALVEKKIIVDGKLSNWEKRQPSKEDNTAADRKRRQREREKAEREAREREEKEKRDKEDVTPCHDVSRHVTTDKTRPDQKRSKEKNTKKEKLPSASVKPDRSEGSFLEKDSNGSGQVCWNIENITSPDKMDGHRESARLLGWDWNFLLQRYHQFAKEPPRYPDKAFKTWFLNFTKGEPPP